MKGHRFAQCFVGFTGLLLIGLGAAAVLRGAHGPLAFLEGSPGVVLVTLGAAFVLIAAYFERVATLPRTLGVGLSRQSEDGDRSAGTTKPRHVQETRRGTRRPRRCILKRVLARVHRASTRPTLHEVDGAWARRWTLRGRRVDLAIGSKSLGGGWRPRTWRAMEARQVDEPVRLLRADGCDYWRFEDAFYRVDGRLGAAELRDLVRARDRALVGGLEPARLQHG
jgi:hypothetical protein